MRSNRNVTRFLCTAILLAGGALAEETKTKEKLSDELVAQLRDMRKEYFHLLGDCYGSFVPDCYLQVGLIGLAPPDPDACREAESMKKSYTKTWQELLSIDRRRVLFDNVPKRIE